MESLALAFLNLLQSIKPYAYILLTASILIGGTTLFFGRSGKTFGLSCIGGGIAGFILITASTEIANWFVAHLNF